MFKVLKNLKQSWLSVVTIVILLCVQATVDLELPNYTSKIVNDGIQAGGIEDSVPEVIKKSDMDKILLFAENSDEIIEKYSLANSENLSSKQTRKLDRYLENDYNAEEFYVVKDLKKDERENLSKEMTKPMNNVISLSKIFITPQNL